jgi:DNA-binding transcriptional LysR family regulator
VQFVWLKDFITLAEAKSFTRAAEIRHVTRPAFGRRIRALELWCGVPLVDRGGYPLELTDEGLAFLEVARYTLRELTDFRERVADAERSRNRALLRIATGRTIARTRLPEWLVATRQDCPELDVRITTGSLHDGVLMLSEGHADVLIAYFHPRLLLNIDSAVVDYCVLAGETLLPFSAARDGQPLFRLPGTLSRPLPHIRFHSTLALAKIEQEALRRPKQAFHLNSEIEIDSPEAALDLCIAGMGVAWLPLSLARRALDQGLVACAAGSDVAFQFEIRAYRLRTELPEKLERFWQLMKSMRTENLRGEVAHH